MNNIIQAKRSTILHIRSKDAVQKTDGFNTNFDVFLTNAIIANDNEEIHISIMSASNAAAIRRRVTQQNTTVTSNETTPKKDSKKPQTPNQMTIQQVITTMDQRLKQVEGLVQNQSNNSDLSMIVDEFNSRFEMIVTELNTLKDTVLQLQTYTMDVNKTLFNERIHVLSDLGNNSITTTDLSKQNSIDNLTETVEK